MCSLSVPPLIEGVVSVPGFSGISAKARETMTQITKSMTADQSVSGQQICERLVKSDVICRAIQYDFADPSPDDKVARPGFAPGGAAPSSLGR